MKKKILILCFIIIILGSIFYFYKRETVIDFNDVSLSIEADKDGNIELNSSKEFCDYEDKVIKYKENGKEKIIVFIKLYTDFHNKYLNGRQSDDTFSTTLFYNKGDNGKSESYSIDEIDGFYYLDDDYNNLEKITADEIKDKTKKSILVKKK